VITHVASFRWKPEAAAADIEAISAALATLPAVLSTIKTYHFGSDLGISAATNMDYAVVATFDSEDDWRIYDQHPEHERVRAELIRPWIAERAAVQFRS